MVPIFTARSSLEKKGRVFYPLSYGENQIRNRQSVHAEENCIDKLPPHKGGKTKKVSLLVIRVTRGGKINMSKPCFKCIEKMNSALQKGYKIDTIYYSNSEGEIEKCSLHNLNCDEHKHVSKYFRRHLKE